MSLDNLTKELDQIARNITRDFRPALREVDKYLTQTISRNFALRQDPDGTPWAKRPSGEEATLIKSRDLLNSLVANGPGGVKDITSDHLERGTNIPYSPFMQYGVPKRRGKKKTKLKYGPPKPGSAAATKVRISKKPPRGRRRFKKKAKMGPVQMRVAARPYIGFSQVDANRIAEIGADFIAEQLVKA